MLCVKVLLYASGLGSFSIFIHNNNNITPNKITASETSSTDNYTYTVTPHPYRVYYRHIFRTMSQPQSDHDSSEEMQDTLSEAQDIPGKEFYPILSQKNQDETIAQLQKDLAELFLRVQRQENDITLLRNDRLMKDEKINDMGRRAAEVREIMTHLLKRCAACEKQIEEWKIEDVKEWEIYELWKKNEEKVTRQRIEEGLNFRRQLTIVCVHPLYS